jgi:hypothetical protein
MVSFRLARAAWSSHSSGRCRPSSSGALRTVRAFLTGKLKRGFQLIEGLPQVGGGNRANYRVAIVALNEALLAANDPKQETRTLWIGHKGISRQISASAPRSLRASTWSEVPLRSALP